MTARDLIDGFETMADAPNGVEKLRELVLDLAIQGKLVAQDPADGPAAIILEEIAIRRSAQRVKKQMPPASVNQDDIPFQVPAGWAWTNCSELGVVGPRNEFGDADEVAFAPMPAIPTDYRQAIQPEVRLWGEIKKGYTHFADGDVVVAKITPCFQNGKACVMSGLPGGGGAGTTELHVLRPFKGTVAPMFLLLFFKSALYVGGGVRTFKGTAGQLRVSNDYFRTRPIPLPPLNEQHRIVAKVDELMSLLDRLEAARDSRDTTRASLRDAALQALQDAEDAEAVQAAWSRISENMDELFTDPADVEPLRQTILQLAVRGRLVPQNPEAEPVADLIAQIQQERSELWERGEAKKPKDIIPIQEDQFPYAIPSKWAWVELGVIAESRLGKMLDKAKNQGEVRPYLRNANLRWFRFSLDDVKEMKLRDDELEVYTLRLNDLVVCEGGEPGRCAVCGSEVSGMVFQKALHRVRPLGGIDPWFLAYLLRCSSGSGRLAELFTGATIKHLTGRSLAKFLVPLPPLEEQLRIVSKVRDLINRCDELETKLESVHSLQTSYAERESRGLVA